MIPVHEGFMRAAIALAEKGLGRTSPNPAVGALIVKGGRVLAIGYHKKAGLMHAEAEALNSLKAGQARGATLYVTLEPCCHTGKRTPPCTAAIARSGIRRVVTGAKDPNPAVNGKGIKALRASGIEVISGVLEKECAAINEAYGKYITRGIPLVTLKLASTIDGRLATPAGESKWITGLESRRRAHTMRAMSDAVLVGGNTVIKDDPELTVRLVKGKNPKKIVLDGSFRAPLSAKVFKGEPPVIFTTRSAPARKIKAARMTGAAVIVLPASPRGVSIKRVLKELGRMQVTSVLIEGGSRIAASALREGVVDRISLFLAPLIIGGDGLASIGPLGIKRLKFAPKIENPGLQRLGSDILIEGTVKGLKK